MHGRSSRRKPSIICREIGGETLLYNPECESIHVLNSTAAAIWRLCDGENDAEAIVVALRRAFANTNSADLGTDVMETLCTLRELGLLEEPDAEPSA